MTIQAATLRDVIRYGASFCSNTALATGTNEEAVAPASNVNGLILWAATMSTGSSAVVQMALRAKSSAPISSTDGDNFLTLTTTTVTAVGVVSFTARLERPVFVASGKGLYFRNSGAAAEGSAYRHILYSLL
jgi:hypothetical protein